MRLLPVPESRLCVIEPLVAQRVAESVMPQNIDLMTFMWKLERGYEMRSHDAYVDNLEKPTYALILSKSPDMWSEDTNIVVLMMHGIPKHRKDTALTDEVFSFIESYARLHGAVRILGTEWHMGGPTTVENVWKSKGFTRMQTTYVKEL